MTNMVYIRIHSSNYADYYRQVGRLSPDLLVYVTEVSNGFARIENEYDHFSDNYLSSDTSTKCHS